MSHDKRKHGVSVIGPWQPVGLRFLRSRACAELSPHAAKLLLDIFAMLGPNAHGNGDISLAPKLMMKRGWRSRETLHAAVNELCQHSLLIQTRQGGRKDCSLYALTLYPLDCDLRKLDVSPGCYTMQDWERTGADVPTENCPAVWRSTRKSIQHDPPRDKAPPVRPAAGRSPTPEGRKKSSSSRHGTKHGDFTDGSVPPRDTFIELPSGMASIPPATMHAIHARTARASSQRH